MNSVKDYLTHQMGKEKDNIYSYRSRLWTLN